GCKNLTLVKFEEGIESIGEYAFGHCYSLKYIVIPTSISCLEKDAFGSCYYVDKILFLGDTIEKWETIEIDTSNSEFLSADVLFYSDIKPNENCDKYWCYKDDEIFLWKHTKITVAEVKSSCTSIGYSEYSYCSDCGEVLKLREILPRTNHTYVNGICSICHSTGDDTDDNISINMPTLSPEYAAALLGFLYNDGDLDQTIIENNDWYKIMIGTYEGDDWEDKAKSLAVFAMDVTQDMSKNANKNADYAKKQLLIYLEKHLKDISSENLTNEAYDQIANYFVDQLIDIASSINPAIGVANAMGEVITGVSDLESCVEEIKEVVNAATNVVVLTYEQEFGGRYEYFQIYIYNRKFYTSNTDSNFENQMLREQIYITQKYKEAGVFDLLSIWTGKESFLVNLDVIDNFAEYIYQLNLYANSIS
ncbi:MAG: leucine-rich repeat protein, partial [Clostridia bacterium]|nr:leucine-rich repeat protein [Clostridia bacterium]